MWIRRNLYIIHKKRVGKFEMVEFERFLISVERKQAKLHTPEKLNKRKHIVGDKKKQPLKRCLAFEVIP